MSESTGASMQYVVLRADGSKEVLRRTAALELKELQALVGGYIEAVRLTRTSNIMCIVNEEGLLMELPPNPHCPGIVGTVVLGKMQGSEFVGLNDGEIKVLEGGWCKVLKSDEQDTDLLRLRYLVQKHGLSYRAVGETYYFDDRIGADALTDGCIYTARGLRGALAFVEGFDRGKAQTEAADA